MKLENMTDLYVHSLRDMYNAEKQLTKALPKLAKAAKSEELAQAFTNHLQETKGHAARVEEILTRLGKRAGGVVCHAAKGLIEEGAEFVEATGDPDVIDAGLIAAAQKVEHYEIASYGCICEFARLLGRKQDVRILEEILSEEKNADSTLTGIAESLVNAEAVN